MLRTVWIGTVWIVTLGLVLGLGLTANAYAGTYTIYNCPAAAAGDYNAGPWRPIWSQPLPSPGVFKQTCSAPGDSFGFSNGLSSDSTAGEQLHTPPSITIQSVKLWWEAPGPISGEGWSFAQIDAYSPSWSRLFEAPTPMAADGAGTSAPTERTLPTGTTELNVQIYCTTSRSCAYSEDPLKIYGSQVTLSDSGLPTGSVTGGDLAGPGPVSGTQSLTYDAADEGSGVRRVELLVDGQPVSENDYLAECPYESFAACPASVSGIVSWNTASVGAGTHEVALRIVNAGGNSIVVDGHAVTVGAVTTGVTVESGMGGGVGTATSAAPGPAAIGPGSPLALRGAANGTNASDQATLTAKWIRTAHTALTGGVLTSRYGASEQIAGRLTTSTGQPISDAAIDVSETPAYEGAHAVVLASPRTGPTGAWALTLPRGVPSSSLRFAYRSHVNDTIPVSMATLTLRVHAGIALGIAPRVTSVGRRIYFSGIVHGPIPPGGKQLVLEASSGGEWIQFDTIRTDARGRYRASYRFKLPGPVDYRFRVVSPYEADFPYLGGTSNGVVVHEL